MLNFNYSTSAYEWDGFICFQSSILFYKVLFISNPNGFGNDKISSVILFYLIDVLFKLKYVHLSNNLF